MSATDVTGNSGPGPPTPSTKSPSHQPRLNFGGSERRKSKKIGHRRVTQEGTVTYKKKPTSEIQRALQLGIQHHIGSIQQQADRDVLYRDFQTIETVHFPPPGSKTTPAHALSDFRFRTYAPIAFRNFRNRYRLDICDFLNSICSQELRELSNPGASGSIFYITQDDEFIIKTVQHREGEFLRALLPSYCLNLMQHPPTLLPKFHGFYCYQTSRKNIRFVVMNNILPSAVRIHEKYDLKGSTYKRQASEKELAKGSPTLKDLDFRARHPQGIYLEAETYDALIKTIERDCLVLESLQIMDYSLLLGIHNLDQAKRERLEQKAASGETKLPIPPLAIPLRERFKAKFKKSTSVTSRGGDDMEPQVNHLSETDGNGVSSSTPRLRTQSHFGKSESTTSDKNQTSPGADGEHTVSSAVTTSVEPPHGSADLATRRFQRGVAAVRSVRRLAAYCTALESIAANSKPVQLEYEELDLLPSGGIPARSSNGDRLLLFLGIIDILQSYRVLKKLEHSFKSLAIDAETVSVTNPSFYSQRFQESLSNSVFKSIQSPLKQGTVKRVSNHAVTLASVDERLPKRSVLPRPVTFRPA